MKITPNHSISFRGGRKPNSPVNVGSVYAVYVGRGVANVINYSFETMYTIPCYYDDEVRQNHKNSVFGVDMRLMSHNAYNA